MAVKLGIIGCGIAANQLHWPALENMRDKFRITAVCNHTPEKARNFAGLVGESYGAEIPFVTDYRKLLARPDVEAVSIMLPAELNLPVCRASAEAGKHILVEKPVAENMESAGALLTLETRYPDLVMMVAENFRYMPRFAALGNLLRTGKIGKPYFVEWKCWTYIDPEKNQYAATRWRIEHKYEGGFVTDGGIHNIAALRDIFGEMEPVGADSRGINPAIGRTDTLVFLFRTSGKAGIPPVTGILNIGYSVRGLTSYTMQVLGTEGSVVLKDDRLEIFEKETGSGPAGVQTYPDSRGYDAEYLDFHSAITTGSVPVSTFKQAYKDLETILKALERNIHV